ncbi:uncharacterized protein CDV56_105290 [Aspergillus thermomutatus]|uniref:glucose oxidase n=1 Tax=Aspergillus thermomutatus TaxID=41047 RepID=A0A397GZD4_ASPTH|nr:uncharacterized protein CDV56_105290 [Aspergillus thermomutatus]RHZ55749.1 hypothetical protein CDV56_105290 [Aspergillus thermomutatus]
MHLRPARSQDLRLIADVAAQAMLEDELFSYLCPGGKSWLIIVAVEDVSPVADSAKVSSLIMGYAVWERISVGAEKSTKQWRETEQTGWWNGLFDPTRPKNPNRRRTPLITGSLSLPVLKEQFLHLTDRCVSRLYPDRSVDKARLASYNALTTECFPFSHFTELWYLAVLAGSPEYRRRGIGRSLVNWGLEQVGREVTPVGLEASARGTWLYEKLGFETVNEVQLVQGIIMRAMLWDNRPPANQRDSELQPSEFNSGVDAYLHTDNEPVMNNIRGAAGCALAVNLARSTNRPRVLLLEAGVRNDNKITNGRQIDYSSGKVLGGSTAINFGIFAVGPRNDYDKWAAVVGDELYKWDRMQPRFRSLETFDSTILEPKNAKYAAPKSSDHGSQGALRVGFASEWEQDLPLILDIFEQAGLVRNPDHNSGNPIGMALVVNSANKGRRITATDLLDTAPEDLKVITESPVQRVVLEAKKAIGVECNGKQCKSSQFDLSAPLRDSLQITLRKVSFE